ncbi:MAG: VWA domain-containing protein, partial [Candidatus Rokuibacteriota bacterium]
MLIRYSRWDGTQRLAEPDADDLLAAMADDLLADGDLASALRRLLQQGARDPRGQGLPGLQELLRQLRQRRQQELDRYDLGSALEDIERKLAEVVQTERQGIERRLAGEEAAGRLEALDRLPPDPAGRLRELQGYAFVEPEARRLFEELLRSLRQQMLGPLLAGMRQALEGMTPADRQRMREMLQELNRMLRERAAGEEPDFEAFRARWGEQFPGVESLDQLIAHLARQAAQVESLLASMSPAQRGQLEAMLQSLLLQDERLDAALRQLAAGLAAVAPLDELRRRYEFRGDDLLSLDQALKLMETLGQMDELERQLRRVQTPEDLARIDPKAVEQALGAEAAQDLERLREFTRKLEEAGYLERGGDRLELTARAIRKIADKALADVFAHLKRDRVGRHAASDRGAGGDRADESKRYEFGDPFLLDLKETLMNAVERGGPGTPVRLAPGDFEVFRTELSTRAATVVMLDMSRSMINNGLFLPAKKVALALHALIRGQFPRDSLAIVGFSLYAREFEPEQLPR